MLAIKGVMEINNYKFDKHGIDEIHIKVADIAIALISDNPDLRLDFEGAMKKFLAEERDSDVRIRARWGDCFEESKGKKLFDSGALWQLNAENGSYVLAGLPT